MNKKEFIQQILVTLLIGLFIYTSGESQLITQFLIPIYLPLSNLGFSRRLLISFVAEKQQKKCEYFQILGLKQSSYLSGWLLNYYFFGLITSFIIIIAITLSNMHYNLIQIIIAQILFTFSQINQSFFISIFFTSPKLAGELGSFIQQLGTLVYFLLFYFQSKQKYVYYLACLIPQTAISLQFMSLSQFDINEIILNVKLDVNKINFIIFLSLMIYFVLYMYFVQVVPNQYGQRKHPLFCFKQIKQQIQNLSKKMNNNFNLLSNSQIEQMNEIQLQNIDNQIITSRDYSSAIYHQPQEVNNLKKSIQIQNIFKSFQQITAIDNVSFNIYEGQIFGLLGHNGAGKTTLINLLTGLFKLDQGYINILGMDVSDEYDFIRNQLGICFQEDIYYDELTVKEHLEYVLKLKSDQFSNSFQQEIQNILIQCDLVASQDKQVQILSGGNKRKLSLAMAILNQNKIIILDEPSSGMDPNSRRKLWDILLKLKSEQRTIILTTHYLDEADLLCDRIGIINQGKLLILGQSEFIKKKFGVGYTINIQNTNYDLDQFKKIQGDIISQCSNLIPEFKQNNQKKISKAVQCLNILMPFIFQRYFRKLFEYIEKNYELQISLEMNTLEDAFINITQNESQFYNMNNNHIEFDEEKTDFTLQYDLIQQLKAIFIRKFLTTKRQLGIIFSYFSPIIFLIIGVLIQQKLLSNLKINLEFRLQLLNLFIIQAYALNCTVYIHIIIKEKEQNIRYLLKIMGLVDNNFWLGNFIFDYIMYLLTIIVFITSIHVMNIKFLFQFIQLMLIILCCFGFSLISYTYLFSLIFKKVNQAYKLFPLINYFLMFLLSSILEVLLKKFIIPYRIQEITFYLISPFTALNNAFKFMPQTLNIKEKEGFLKLMKLYQNEKILDNSFQYCILMIFQSIIYFSLLRLFEERQYYNKQINDRNNEIKIQNNSQNSLTGLNNNEEIQQEFNRIAMLGNNDNIKTFRLYKVYENGFQALNDISFGVQNNQVFGLLGPNGAGKSTTFNILSGSIQKTKGNIFLFNEKLNLLSINDQDNFIGVSPQFMGLYDQLTIKEHLELFSKIKGVQKSKQPQLINYVIKQMNLFKYKDLLSYKLSGGNKKKLSVANALIGKNRLLFLDEPSNGLDPLNKRNLQINIQNYVKDYQSSIVLTTHSMQEAEYLCQKIGILINGQFVCMGNLQQLKCKYGDGYQIRFKCENKQTQITLKNNYMDYFTDSYLKNEYQLLQNEMIIKIKSKQLLFHKIFQFIEGNIIQSILENQQLIEDYSIQQCSLEKIFLDFSKYQLRINQE